MKKDITPKSEDLKRYKNDSTPKSEDLKRYKNDSTPDLIRYKKDSTPKRDYEIIKGRDPLGGLLCTT